MRIEPGYQPANYRKGIAHMCLAIILWVVAEGIFMSLNRYSFLEVIWIRYGTHLFFIMSILALRRTVAPLRTRRPAIQILRGIMMIGMPVLAVVGARSARIGDVLSFWQFAPLMVLLLSITALSEPVRFNRWGATFAAFIGACLMVRIDKLQISSTSILLAGSAICFSIYQILTRILREEYTLANLFFTALVVFVPISFFQAEVWVRPSIIDGMLMVAIGLVGCGLLWAIDRAYELAPASLLAPYAYLLPVLIALEKTILSASRPPVLSLLGGALILVTLLILFFSEKVNCEREFSSGE